ncbi:MAG: response regulator [Bacteroidetes bacterium]|nr:response regulator [Bacteroidota bacterium]
MEETKLGMHIFIAEDEELISNLYRLQLEREGYKVTIAENGQKAVEMLKDLAAKPEVLLLDLGLPDLDGQEVYEEAVKLFGSTPTIFCSGNYSDSVNSIWLSEHPNTRLLLKPVSMKTITEVVEQLLDL